MRWYYGDDNGPKGAEMADAESSRRNFLLGAAGLTGVAAAATVWPATAAGAAPSDGRSYTAGRFAFILDGEQLSGYPLDAEGGEAYADVLVDPPGPDGVARKRPGRVKYGDITLKTGIGMSKGFYEWVKSAFDGKYERRNGAVIAANFDYRERARVQFSDALITEVGMPALDAASKDAAKMTVKFAPEITRRSVKSAGKQLPPPPSGNNQKAWLPSNFRLRIDGLDAACSRVNKIEALTIKQKVTENAVGELRDYEKEPASVEVPNLVITVPESHAKAFYDWHEDFVIKGENTPDREKGGTLEYLANDLKTVLFTLTFSNLGIFKLVPDKVESGSDQIRRVKAEMYCEDIRFDYKGPTWS